MGGKSVAATAGASLIAATGALVTGVLAASPAVAGPAHCNDAFCTPGITPNVVLGTPCDRTDYFVFGTAVAGPSKENYRGITMLNHSLSPWKRFSTMVSCCHWPMNIVPLLVAYFTLGPMART